MDSSKKSVETQNREIAVPIWPSTWGQVGYKFAHCPICGCTNNYLDGRSKCYCPGCGQKLVWIHHEKSDSQKQIKRYKIVFRLVGLENVEFRIIKAITMYEAICTFHLFTKSQRIDVLEAYEFIDTEDKANLK